jgi:putative FmdB family regulatory protein
MPTYKYVCPDGHEHEEFKKVSERASNPCPECGATAKLEIVPVHLDYMNCGVDTGFPTAAAKWEKMQRNKGSGKQWDSNNLRYGGEHERRR